MNHTPGSSHLKFANDLMCFVCCYYDLDWEGNPPSTVYSVIRFTSDHADTVGRYLQWLDDGMWSRIRDRVLRDDPLLHFLTGATLLKDLFKESVFSTHNFLFYCTLVARLAVEAAKAGTLAAPFQAVFMIGQTLTDFRLGRTLSHSTRPHDSVSDLTRTIL